MLVHININGIAMYVAVLGFFLDQAAMVLDVWAGLCWSALAYSAAVVSSFH